MSLTVKRSLSAFAHKRALRTKRRLLEPRILTPEQTRRFMDRIREVPTEPHESIREANRLRKQLLAETVPY